MNPISIVISMILIGIIFYFCMIIMEKKSGDDTRHSNSSPSMIDLSKIGQTKFKLLDTTANTPTHVEPSKDTLKNVPGDAQK